MGGYMTTVSVIGNNDSWWMNYSIMRIRGNVFQMEKLPYLEVRAHYRLPGRTNDTNA